MSDNERKTTILHEGESAPLPPPQVLEEIQKYYDLIKNDGGTDAAHDKRFITIYDEVTFPDALEKDLLSLYESVCGLERIAPVRLRGKVEESNLWKRWMYFRNLVKNFLDSDVVEYVSSRQANEKLRDTDRGWGGVRIIQHVTGKLVEAGFIEIEKGVKSDKEDTPNTPSSMQTKGRLKALVESYRTGSKVIEEIPRIIAGNHAEYLIFDANDYMGDIALEDTVAIRRRVKNPNHDPQDRTSKRLLKETVRSVVLSPELEDLKNWLEKLTLHYKANNIRFNGESLAFVSRIPERAAHMGMGRIYHGMQSMPKTERPDLKVTRMGGSERSCVELDFAGMHWSILKRIVDGQEYDEHYDPYAAPLRSLGWPTSKKLPQRGYMKTLMLTCMNTGSDSATIGAFNESVQSDEQFDEITGAIRDEKKLLKSREVNVRDMLDAVKKAYPQMAEYLCSDCGVVMQALEARMLRSMINHLYYGQMIECWPLHDALYVPLLEERWAPQNDADVEYQQMDGNYLAASFAMDQSFEEVLEGYSEQVLKADLEKVHQGEPHLSDPKQ